MTVVAKLKTSEKTSQKASRLALPSAVYAKERTASVRMTRHRGTREFANAFASRRWLTGR